MRTTARRQEAVQRHWKQPGTRARRARGPLLRWKIKLLAAGDFECRERCDREREKSRRSRKQNPATRRKMMVGQAALQV